MHALNMMHLCPSPSTPQPQFFIWLSSCDETTVKRSVVLSFFLSSAQPKHYNTNINNNEQKKQFFFFHESKKKNRNKFTSTAGNRNRFHSVQLHRYVFIVRLFCFLSLLSVANPGCRHSQSHTVYDRSMRKAQ